MLNNRDPSVEEAKKLVEELWASESTEPDDFQDALDALDRGRISARAYIAYCELRGAYDGEQDATKVLSFVAWFRTAADMALTDPPHVPDDENVFRVIYNVVGSEVFSALREEKAELRRLLREELVPNMLWPFGATNEEDERWKNGDGSVDYTGD